MTPLISVIVPAYNAAEGLARCLDSLLSQTWPALEVLLVDDGSTDATADIARDYARRDSRVSVLSQPNGGVSSARNAGLAACRGELIAFADADDWVKPEWLACMADTLLRQQADMAVCGYIEQLPVKDAAPLIRGTVAMAACGPREAAYQLLRRDGWFTALWNKLIRRDRLMTEDGPLRFDETLAVGEDETWLLRLLPRLERVVFCPRALYCWTSRPDSASRKQTITPRSLSVLRAKEMAAGLVEDFAP